MTDARDHVLHYALKRVHQETQEKDLLPEILAAWERGVRGSGVPDEELEEVREWVDDVPERRRAPVLARALGAAAILGVSGFAVWLARSSESDDERAPVAQQHAEEEPPSESGPFRETGQPVAGVISSADVARAETLFLDMCDDLVELAAGGALEKAWFTDVEEIARELVVFLEEKPALWEALRPKITAQFAGMDEPDWFLARILDFVALHPSSEALELGRDLWLQRPDTFSEEHIVAFAERGAFEFRRELPAALAFYRSGALDPADVPYLAAIHLAFRGDEAGVEFLSEHVPDSPTDYGVFHKVMAAAVALDFQGHPEHWARCVRLVRAEVDDALGKGDLDMAKMLAIGTEYFDEFRAASEVIPLSHVARNVARHFEKRKDQVESEAQIRALIGNF